MTTQPFRYTFASSPSTTSQRPSCFGSKFDNEARECKECEWKDPCRATIVQLNSGRFTSQSPTYYSSGPQQMQYAVPTPVPYFAPPQQQQVFRPSPTPVQVIPQQQMTYRPPTASGSPQVAPTHVGWYGAVQDPAFGTIHSIPPPFRPQFQGESFPERIIKNAVLSGLEAVTKEFLLGLRQVFLAP